MAATHTPPPAATASVNANGFSGGPSVRFCVPVPRQQYTLNTPNPVCSLNSTQRIGELLTNPSSMDVIKPMESWRSVQDACS